MPKLADGAAATTPTNRLCPKGNPFGPVSGPDWAYPVSVWSWVPWLEELQHVRVVDWEVQVEETTRSEGFEPRDAGLPRWLRDEPLDLRKDDQFGVDQLVDRLVGLLARAKPPFTLSLSGAWGVGKSTVADAIVARLKERKVRAVKIDAWTQDVAQLRRSVVIEVGAALKAGSDADRKALAEELDEARATRIEVQSARVEARELRPTLRQIQRSRVPYLVLAAILAIPGTKPRPWMWTPASGPSSSRWRRSSARCWWPRWPGGS